MEAVAARLLASPILQEYDAFTVDELGVNPANQFGNLTDSGFGNMQAAQPCGNRRSLWEGADACSENSSLWAVWLKTWPRLLVADVTVQPVSY